MNKDDGSLTPTRNPHDDTHRHQCEVRWLIRRYYAAFYPPETQIGRAKAEAAVRSYLALVTEKRKRDPDAAGRLRADTWRQLQLGNEGKDGDWRE